MTNAATLVRESRQGAGLSMRALARRADVAYTTVFGIEHGEHDATTAMLTRLLEAAGAELVLSARPLDTPHLADLADAWRRSADGQVKPDWTRLRGFIDFLARHPALRGPATLRRPAPSGSSVIDNLLAGIAEKTCDDAGLPRPDWTQRLRPLDHTWEASGSPRARAAAATTTPPQLAARGLHVGATSLWRDQATVGL